jgi:hypothetical protein
VPPYFWTISGMAELVSCEVAPSKTPIRLVFSQSGVLSTACRMKLASDALALQRLPDH